MRTDREQYRCRTLGHFILPLLLVWIFVGTIDGPALNLQIDSGPVLVKTLKLPSPERSIHGELQWMRIEIGEPPPVNRVFLLFDFKQNLRRWPNISGNISRSPPLPLQT